MLLSAFHTPSRWALMDSPIGLHLFAVDWLRASWQTRAAWLRDETERVYLQLDVAGLCRIRFRFIGTALAEVMDGHVDILDFDAAVTAFREVCQRDLVANDDFRRNAPLEGIEIRLAALRDYALATTEMRSALLRHDYL